MLAKSGEAGRNFLGGIRSHQPCRFETHPYFGASTPPSYLINKAASCRHSCQKKSARIQTYSSGKIIIPT